MSVSDILTKKKASITKNTGKRKPSDKKSKKTKSSMLGWIADHKKAK